ncbi:MAG: c-type cytochrome [Cytophagaceae bacterium]|nr:c-type cytochrome [Cytophagaceae bacterium]
MKNRFTPLLLLAVGLGAFAFVSCQPSEPAKTATVAEISPDSLVKRGDYLVTTMACGDCHSPLIMGPQGPEPDPARILSGHPANLPLAAIDKSAAKNWVMFNATGTAVVGPWGVSFTANLTSDPTGIGNWSEEQFARALKEGKSKGIATNRSLLPPMPWMQYRHLNDADIKAIFAYLKSTKPVNNLVPAPISPAELAKR